jgi:hypothetical protein
MDGEGPGDAVTSCLVYGMNVETCKWVGTAGRGWCK